MDSSPGPDERPRDELELKVALAAAILGGGAFIIAFLQTFLQYSSSSMSRNKCTFQAIGFAANNVRIGWNWRLWKLTVEYPLLNLSEEKLMILARKNNRQNAINGALSPIDDIVSYSRAGQWAFQAVNEREPISPITDGYYKLVKKSGGGGDVTLADLTWKERFTVWRWKSTHICAPITRPRASWAQLLMVLGIRDVKALVYRHVDADVIPGPVDVPLQRVRLYDLGTICLRLGFKEVSINLRDRDFNASNEHGSVATIDIKGHGKMLHFEGDILASMGQIARGDFETYLSVPTWIHGVLTFGPISTKGYIWPLHLLVSVASNGWNQVRYEIEEANRMRTLRARGDKEGLKKGEVAVEAQLFDEYRQEMGAAENEGHLYHGSVGAAEPGVDSNTPSHGTDMQELQWLGYFLDRAWPGIFLANESGRRTDDLLKLIHKAARKWQRSTGENIPTIIAAAALASVGCCETAFPSRIYLEPFMPWVADTFKGVVAEAPKSLINTNVNLEVKFKQDRLGFSRANTSIWYAKRGHETAHNWTSHAIKEIYDNIDREFQNNILPLNGWSYTGEVHALLFPSCAALLSAKFYPRNWVNRTRFINRLSMDQLYRPNSMLWAQILILDVAIHFLVRGGWHAGGNETYQPWKPEVVAVIKAVVDSWAAFDDVLCAPGMISTPTEKPRAADGLNHQAEATSESRSGSTSWNLLESLRKQEILFHSLDPPMRELRLQELATLLKLRAAFCLALWMLIPDSSDVLLARGSSVEMPMI